MDGSVTFQDGFITLPTYAPGGYDKTPIFYTGRVYQGAQGRVYPYPMQDVLHDEKRDERYRYLSLENRWLKMGLLPEHGGHLLNFTDRQTGYEIFYRQHVIKPALIGMLGAWISGGVEWNFPHHHRPTTAMPVDWRMTEQRDGSKTIWIGETELRHYLKWSIGLSLLPDRAVMRCENIFMNRGPFIESMIFWANASVHCSDSYQIQFPPSCHLGFDHHKNYWTTYPIGPRKEEIELLPSQRSKCADDISGEMDLSWWKNFTIESRSIFAMDPDNAWVAGYDHDRECGTAHVSNRHIAVGKKFFLWGNFPEAHVWDKVLSDSDGPYLELMAGCWSDNQPDYSWIAPYETRRVEQYWFPVKGIGGVKNVTIDGAVNVERVAADKLLVGFHSTRELDGCVVRLLRGGEVVFEDRGVSIGPDAPWRRELPVRPDDGDHAYTAVIFDADDRAFLSYSPVSPAPREPLPPRVENPKPPQEYASAELAYEVGLRLDQFHNGLVDPVPYYERALEIDPDYTKANLAMGVRLLQNGSFAEAGAYLERAVARATQNHTRALDAAPEYYLACALRGAGEYRRAEELFWRSTWRLTHKKESYVELARLASLRNSWDEALQLIDEALALGSREAHLHTLRGIFLRQLGRRTEARHSFAEARRLDPLEMLGVLCADGVDAALEHRGLKAQSLLQCVAELWGLGLWAEVAEICRTALASADEEPPYRTGAEALPLEETLAACSSMKNSLFAVFEGAAHWKLGDENAAREAWRKADAMPTDYVFPNRLEEEQTLRMALQAEPELANLWYLLGCSEWNHDRKDAGLTAWRRCVSLAPKHALALRCLGFGLSHPGSYFTNTGVPSGVASSEAFDYYLRSLREDPDNFRTLDETGRLAEKLNMPAAERAALMERYRKTAEKYDPCMLRLAYIYNELGRFREAYDILTGRRFHVWEGGDGLLIPFVDACIGLGKEAMERGDCELALAFFEESTTYPENLQAGRPGDAGSEPKSRYFMAQCRKALGDDDGYRRELLKALHGWIRAGEMDYWRVRAMRELGGREAEIPPLLAELRQAIGELETPPPEIINAYAKFAGENSAMERAAKARGKAAFLRKLLEELENE